MLQQPVQTAIQPVFVGYCEALFQQRIHGTFHKPMPVYAELAARLQQPIHYQQPQHFLPAHALPSRWQSLPPEGTQPQLMPQFTG